MAMMTSWSDDDLARQMEGWDELYAAEPNTGCWLWLGSCSRDGCPLVEVGARVRFVHEVIYETIKGPIPPFLRFRHRCCMACCVNPAHLVETK